jgi:hypothetical protein
VQKPMGTAQSAALAALILEGSDSELRTNKFWHFSTQGFIAP